MFQGGNQFSFLTLVSTIPERYNLLSTSNFLTCICLIGSFILLMFPRAYLNHFFFSRGFFLLTYSSSISYYQTIQLREHSFHPSFTLPSSLSSLSIGSLQIPPYSSQDFHYPEQLGVKLINLWCIQQIYLNEFFSLSS